MRLPTAILLAVLLSPCALAQDSARTFTQLLLGAGFPPSGGTRFTPTWTAGFEIGFARSPVRFRVAVEDWQSEVWRGADRFTLSWTDSWQKMRYTGAQLLAVRTFGTRRVQPYALGGMGLYWRTDRGVGPRYAFTDSGVQVVGSQSWDRRELLPTLIWGVGTSVRLFGGHVFMETKLPLYGSGGFYRGPHAPLLFGVRF